MKKFLLIVLPIAALFASCRKEQTSAADETVAGSDTFTAYIEDGVKTELNGDLDVLWCEGDSLSVFDEAGTNFKFITKDSGKTATFTKVTAGKMVGETFYAVYPYRYNASISEGTITTNTVSSYTLSGTSFTRGASAVMAAKTSGNELHFKNASSLLKFTIPSGVSIKKLYFYASGNSLSGEFKFNLDDQNIPVITENIGPNNGVTVMVEEGSFPAGTYYLPVIPAEYNNLRVQITYAGDKACTVSEAFSINAFTANRNEARNIGTIYDGRSHYKWLTFEDGIVPGTSLMTKKGDVSYSVVGNPQSGNTNDSQKALYIERTNWKNSNAGETVIDLSGINGNIRKRITGVVFHFKPGPNLGQILDEKDTPKICPRVSLVKDLAKAKGPVKINNSVSEDPAGFSGGSYSELIDVKYWKTLTFKASQFVDEDGNKYQNFENINSIIIWPFLWSSGSIWTNQVEIAAYIDNIGFCFD